MPAPQERDLNKATEDFKNWLINEKDQDASIAVEVLGGPENTGFSNETLSFNVTQGTETTGYVLRFHPSCLLYTSPSPRDMRRSRMPSSA